MQLGDRHRHPAGLELTAHAAGVGAHRRLGDRRAVLIDEALPDPPRRVPLLAGRAQVGDEPLPDDLHVRTELRRRSGCLLALRRQRRLQRLPYRAPVHVVAARQLAYGQPLLSPCPSDILEQLHPRHTPLLSLGGGLSRPERSCWMGRGWGQFRGSKRPQVGPNQSSVPTSRGAPCGKRVRGPSQRSQEGTRRRRLVRRSRTASCRSCAGWRKGPEQIADELEISVHTVPNHVRNARRKL